MSPLAPSFALAAPLLAWLLPPLTAASQAPAEPEPATDVQFVQQAPAQLEVGEIVSRLQARYDAIVDFQARFTQETLQIALAETRVSGGEVYFMRPGRMLWDYGDARRLVLDGENLHSVDFENAQYYSAPVASSDLPTAMRFLMGQGNLAEDFEVTLLEDSTPARAVLDLVPREPSADYQRLVFVVDTSTWDVVETAIVDELGNTNTIRFSDIRTNVGMAASAFTFVPPPGLTRIEVPD